MYYFCLFLSYKKVIVLVFAVKNFVYNGMFITKLKYDFLHLFKNHEIALALDISCQGVYNFSSHPNWRITHYRKNYFFLRCDIPVVYKLQCTKE